MARSFLISSSQRLFSASTPITDYPFTAAMWFMPDDVTNSYNFFNISKGTVSQRVTLISGGAIAGDPIRLATRAGVAGATQVDTTTAISTTAWNHACVVGASATSRSIYLNGGGKATDTNSKSPTVSQIDVAATAGSAADYNGSIAEIAMWDAALTDDEVAVLAKGFSPLLVRLANLVDWCPIIGRASPEPDFVGRHEFTLFGSPPEIEHPRIIRPRISA